MMRWQNYSIRKWHHGSPLTTRRSDQRPIFMQHLHRPYGFSLLCFLQRRGSQSKASSSSQGGSDIVSTSEALVARETSGLSYIALGYNAYAWHFHDDQVPAPRCAFTGSDSSQDQKDSKQLHLTHATLAGQSTARSGAMPIALSRLGV